ncbi:MAG: alpha/beta hydrolase [Firmicutes bacterium]|nr:alpha/beta hydrolase [Bacillota bacterium]
MRIKLSLIIPPGKGSCRIKILLYVLITLVIAGIFIRLFFYGPAIKTAYSRLDNLEREVVDTPHGPIEYGVRGSGAPVLLLHGAAGGFDQGLNLAADHVPATFQAIVPSRFGYLGTSLPKDATVAMQADAYIALLDELGLEQVAVIAYSAGGASAFQLANRYPERVSALILISTALSEGEEISLPPQAVMSWVAGSDFMFWLMTHPFRPLAQRMFIQANYELSAEQDEQAAEIIGSLLPMRPRREGFLFDFYVSNTDTVKNSEEYKLEELTVPTLLINAKDDPAAQYEAAVAMEQRIPNARLVTIEKGGHLMFGSEDLVQREIDRFLREYVE